MFWAAEALRVYVEMDRGAPPVAHRLLPRPRSAHLAADGTLSWKWYTKADLHGFGESHHGRFLRVHTRLCEHFAALADDSDDAIRRFAERWGPLRYPRSRPRALDETESIKEWRKFAVLARALVRSTIASHQGTRGHLDDLRSICEWLQIAQVRDATAEDKRLLVVMALNQWHNQSGGNALLGMSKDKIVMRPRSFFLFGIIGLQLAYAVSGAQDTLVCYHCQRFYTPKHKPRTGTRNFCKHCRRLGKPQLYAMRDLRARKRRDRGAARE